jgi:hypothetical protein
MKSPVPTLFGMLGDLAPVVNCGALNMVPRGKCICFQLLAAKLQTGLTFALGAANALETPYLINSSKVEY